MLQHSFVHIIFTELEALSDGGLLVFNRLRFLNKYSYEK